MAIPRVSAKMLKVGVRKTFGLLTVVVSDQAPSKPRVFNFEVEFVELHVHYLVGGL